MNADLRRERTPQEYINSLFEETENGKLSITYEPFFDQPYTLTYDVNWTKADADALVERYNILTAALEQIGKFHDKSDSKEEMQKVLTPEEFEVWDIYIRPFEEPFEVDDDVVTELYLRRESDSLEEEENELLERHHEWFVSNSRKRLPDHGMTTATLINRARRYERLASLNAPRIVITEEGRSLAEEMIKYYHCRSNN